jgi:hypothetical protein
MNFVDDSADLIFSLTGNHNELSELLFRNSDNESDKNNVEIFTLSQKKDIGRVSRLDSDFGIIFYKHQNRLQIKKLKLVRKLFFSTEAKRFQRTWYCVSLSIIKDDKVKYV